MLTSLYAPWNTQKAIETPAPGGTNLILVTSLLWLDITPLTDCTALIVFEDNAGGAGPTTLFQIARPTSASAFITIGIGQSMPFIAPPGRYWAAGVPIGAIRLPSGSAYFAVSENGA